MFLSDMRRRSLGIASTILLSALTLILPLLAGAQQPETNADCRSTVAAQQFIIPDGTEVELRFAQEVAGKAVRANPLVPPPSGVPEAQAGDLVRLVATANVRIDGRVVIAKGAIGRATITNAVPVLYNKHPSEETGLFLQLDWIKGVDGAQIPLRAFKKGKPGRFHADVKSEHGGVVIHPQKTLPIFAAISNNENDFPADEKKKNWIPLGSRIAGFVQGAITLGRSEVEQAQAQLPISASTAVLTIYRTKDDHHSQVLVSCDGKQVAQIGERQYAVVELAPGHHSCQIAAEKALTITAAVSEEYFIHLQPRMFGGWELKLVSASEGEDGIAGAEMAQ